MFLDRRRNPRHWNGSGVIVIIIMIDNPAALWYTQRGGHLYSSWHGTQYGDKSASAQILHTTSSSSRVGCAEPEEQDT